MDAFQHMDLEYGKYLLQLLKTADFTHAEMKKEVKKIIEQVENYSIINSFLMRDSQIKDMKISKAVGELTAYARKILYNEKINDKTYEHARRKYAKSVSILMNQAGYLNEEQLYSSFAARTVNLLEKTVYAKKQQEGKTVLGKPTIETGK